MPSFRDLQFQNKLVHSATARHWSGFLRSLAARFTQFPRKESQFSSPNTWRMRWHVPMISEMALNLFVAISSSYSVIAFI